LSSGDCCRPSIARHGW